MNPVIKQEEKRTVGQLLRAAREARGISREQAASATRIKPVFLGAMENDDYHLLPDERYLLRFLGEYATYLELDPQEVQRRFSRQIARGSGSLAVLPGKQTVTLSLRRLLPGLLVLAILIPSVFIVLSILGEQPRETRQPEAPEAPQEVSVAPPVDTPPSPSREIVAEDPVATITPAVPDQPVSSDTPPSRETVTEDPVATVTPAVPDQPVSSDARGAAEAGHILRAEAKEMTWMLVTIDGGETKDVLLQAGETWVWRAQQGFVVTIGNAAGVSLILNGRPVPSLGRPGEVIRNLRLPNRASHSLESP